MMVANPLCRDTRPGATALINAKAGYGFSGDSFGSGNLLLSGTYSTLLAICQKTSAIMEKHGIKFLFPGHYFGNNREMKQRIDDERPSAGMFSPAKQKVKLTRMARWG